MLVLRLRCSVSEIQLGRKNKHRLNLILKTKTTLIDSYILSSNIFQTTSGGQTEPIHAPLVSRCTRDAEPRKRRPRSFQPPFYPPAPADTRDGAALARGAALWVHARTQKKKKKKGKKALAGKYYNRRRRCPSGSSEMPGMGQPRNFRRKESISNSI